MTFLAWTSENAINAGMKMSCGINVESFPRFSPSFSQIAHNNFFAQVKNVSSNGRWGVDKIRILQKFANWLFRDFHEHAYICANNLRRNLYTNLHTPGLGVLRGGEK